MSVLEPIWYRAEIETRDDHGRWERWELTTRILPVAPDIAARWHRELYGMGEDERVQYRLVRSGQLKREGQS